MWTRVSFCGLLLPLLLGCPAKVPPVPPTPEIDVAELAHLRNLGLAAIENEQLDQSNELFEELVEKVPGELLSRRNFAVSKTMTVMAVDRNKFELVSAAQREFEAAIVELQNADDSEIPWILSALGHTSLDQTFEAIQELKTATEKNPKNATAWFQLFTASRFSNDEAVRQQGSDALLRAYELRPNNLIVILESLIVQAENKSEAIKSTLEAARPILAQLAPGLQKRVRIDITKFVDDAIAAAGEGNWPVVQRNVRILKNVVQPDDAAQSDRQRLEKHPLEYVIEEFSAEIEDKIATLRRDSLEEIEFEFMPRNMTPSTDLPIHDAQFADLNLDGKLEIVLLQQKQLSVIEPSSESELLSVKIPDGLEQLVIADLENNPDDSLIPEGQKEKICHTADLEIVAYGSAGISFLQTKLSTIGGEIGLEPFEVAGEISQLKNVEHVHVADVNNDGDLDLVIIADGSLSLWSNQGSLVFSKIAPTWQLDAQFVDAVSADIDFDVDTDIVLLTDSGEIGYLENLRHGTFRWQALSVKPRSFTAQSIGLTDYDNDGEWDLIAAGVKPGSGDPLRGTNGTVLAKFLSTDSKEIDPSVGGDGSLVAFQDCDFDNNGFQDLLLVTDEMYCVYHGDGTNHQGNGSVMHQLGIGEPLRSVDLGDVDNDGDEDFLIAGTTGIQISENKAGNKNKWLDIELLAQQQVKDQTTASGRVNQYGIGSVIEVRSGVNYQKKIVTGPKTRFGLGSQSKADAARVLWTNGIPGNILEPAANQLICERQSLKGSCPYLYTWDGEKFVFVTDLLWASPIGLQNPQGELVPARNWEYLKIPGEMLEEKDGEYILQLTEELWEVAYFDRVELIAVDHPAEVDVFSNDKVGPPSISEFKLHTVRKRIYPKAVTNQSGVDLLPKVCQRDEQYAKPFDHKIRQGYTTDSWIEIDLGISPPPKEFKLFLTGWIYPTDTSINAALHENESLPGPKPLSLSVLNKAGAFEEVIPFTGFPGGKTKTIVLELKDIFQTDDSRLRLETSSEFYWDETFFTVDDQPAEIVTQTLSLVAADLHHRGVSKKLEHPDYGPERYEYSVVTKTPVWPPIQGEFTNYGDVLPLIREADDEMVVMGSGDEMTMRFAAPKGPVPGGWKRDFIIHNVGWDKDADLHTVYGTHVAPLPSLKMLSYPDLDREFKTPHMSRSRRQASRRFWNDLVRPYPFGRSTSKLEAGY